MSYYFLNRESSEIINKLTLSPFGLGDHLWLYWLCTIELIPGGWHVRLYLESSDLEKPAKYSFTGWGKPDEAIKMAYGKIDKKWLEKGFKRGSVLNERYNVTCSPEEETDE